MFYITPLTANELINKKILLQKESKNAASYTSDQLTPESLDLISLLDLVVTSHVHKSLLKLILSFLARSDYLYHRGEVVTPYVWPHTISQVRLLAMEGFYPKFLAAGNENICRHI